ncbi:MAG TPA: PEGA domain-containing protein, partial [Planctomycetota bacterium]|nr:PEGA domain-containing protein [Planctomycetota bacterium]
MSRAAIFALAAPIALAACSTGVVIDSEPHGARVLVDGEVVGITPFTARLPITTFGTYSFVAELPGYRTAEGELPQETNPEAIALSIFFPPG